jgi:hypothetical protein
LEDSYVVVTKSREEKKIERERENIQWMGMKGKGKIQNGGI